MRYGAEVMKAVGSVVIAVSLLQTITFTAMGLEPAGNESPVQVEQSAPSSGDGAAVAGDSGNLDSASDQNGVSGAGASEESGEGNAPEPGQSTEKNQSGSQPSGGRHGFCGF